MMKTILLSAVVMMFSTACSVFGIQSVEEAPYKMVREDKPYEIRDYSPLVVAQTRVNADFKEAGNVAFRKLFAYISGDNEAQQKIAMTAPVIAEPTTSNSGEKIAMTAPVTAQKEGDSWLYRFVLPDSYSLDTAPKPLDSDVSILETVEKRVATIRYSGRATDESRQKQTEALMNWIASEDLVPVSEPRWAGYNAPFTIPFFRRNEVLVDISKP